MYVGEGDWPEKRVVFQIIVKTRDAFQALRIVQLLIWPDICNPCLLYTSPSPRDRGISRMPSSA